MKLFLLFLIGFSKMMSILVVRALGYPVSPAGYKVWRSVADAEVVLLVSCIDLNCWYVPMAAGCGGRIHQIKRCGRGTDVCPWQNIAITNQGGAANRACAGCLESDTEILSFIKRNVLFTMYA